MNKETEKIRRNHKFSIFFKKGVFFYGRKCYNMLVPKKSIFSF